MTQKDIEKHIQLDTIGWRPTWNFSTSIIKFKGFEKVFSDYFDFFKKKNNQSKMNKKKSLVKNALKILNIDNENVTIKLIENKYKKLVKKYHPDRNNGNKEYEEKLKKVNQAFEEVKKQVITKSN